ncbi:flagellar export chaperone FlgN [Tissierella sp.]|uniref:flagellar export chaperone FlgN n=1 Tax=Tissierella sp. TaxID=41274 RepID=UPI00305B4167
MTFREELEVVMEKELTVLTELKELSFKKADMIINNHMRELEETTKKEETLINEMALLEEEREKLLDTWGLAVNTPISNVIERIPEDNNRLIYIRDKMKEVMAELSLRNKLNNDLIQDNLDWIDFNMNLITNTHIDPGYGKENKKSSGNSIFDRKV